MSLSGLDFEVSSPDCDEQIENTTPEHYVEELSKRKAHAACAQLEHAVIIGADTVVSLDARILGKPENEAEAEQMLRDLSGKKHEVYTGVTVIDSDTGKEETFFEMTEVFFYELSETEIRSYVASKEPMDKAGAYGIQGRGAFLVRKINGDYYNVVGLPLARLLRVLKGFRNE